MKYAGQTACIVCVDGERDDLRLSDALSELQAASGLKIEITTMALFTIDQSIAQNLRAPESEFGIVHIQGFTIVSTPRCRVTRGHHRLRHRPLAHGRRV
jgi:hypothetical protein